MPDEHKGKLNWTFNTCNLRVWQGFSDSKAKLHLGIYICTELTPGVDHILCQALARGAQFLAGWVIERKEWPHWHPGEDCTQAPCRGSSVNTTWRVAKTTRINLEWVFTSIDIYLTKPVYLKKSYKNDSSSFPVTSKENVRINTACSKMWYWKPGTVQTLHDTKILKTRLQVETEKNNGRSWW